MPFVNLLLTTTKFVEDVLVELNLFCFIDYCIPPYLGPIDKFQTALGMYGCAVSAKYRPDKISPKTRCPSKNSAQNPNERTSFHQL